MAESAPIRYRIAGLPGREYLAFRTEQVDGRLLLSLIPDSCGGEQHQLDVVACFLDDPKLTEIKEDARG